LRWQEGYQSILKGFELAMNRLVVLCLVLIVGIAAFAQQPIEWRPNIAEDNKAASWEDTSAFMISVLDNKARSPLQATSPRRCVMEEMAIHGLRTKIYHYEIGGIDPLSISVVTTSDKIASIVSFAGTGYRPYGQLIVVDRDLKQPSTISVGRCSANENSCKETPSVLTDPDVTEFTDEESARRFARALMHAALLCGGTKAVSPF
jgi:hypothetical protein